MAVGILVAYSSSVGDTEYLPSVSDSWDERALASLILSRGIYLNNQVNVNKLSSLKLRTERLLKKKVLSTRTIVVGGGGGYCKLLV